MTDKEEDFLKMFTLFKDSLKNNDIVSIRYYWNEGNESIYIHGEYKDKQLKRAQTKFKKYSKSMPYSILLDIKVKIDNKIAELKTIADKEVESEKTVKEMFNKICPSCEAVLQNGAKYCHSCGRNESVKMQSRECIVGKDSIGSQEQLFTKLDISPCALCKNDSETCKDVLNFTQKSCNGFLLDYNIEEEMPYSCLSCGLGGKVYCSFDFESRNCRYVRSCLKNL